MTSAERPTLSARKSVRTKSILLMKDERMRVYFPHEQYIWIKGEIINEVKKYEYEVFIDDSDIPDEVKDSMHSYCGKLDTLPLQNEGMEEEGVDDMVTLNYLHEASILDNLRRRFKHKLPYTYVGNICMAVNPYQWIGEIYTKDLKNAYLQNLRHDMKPHVYGTSASSYKGLRDYNKNQSILVSGESGAGKVSLICFWHACKAVYLDLLTCRPKR
jgi:myosin V